MNSTSSISRRIKALLAAVALLSSFLLMTPARTEAQARASSRPTRIKFMSGAVSAQVRGQLRKNADTFFVVKAEAGQHMIVNIIPLTRGLMTGGIVRSPSGQEDGQHGGFIFNDDLTETGDYTIRVDPNLMGSERADGAFMLEVVITPASLKNW